MGWAPTHQWRVARERLGATGTVTTYKCGLCDRETVDCSEVASVSRCFVPRIGEPWVVDGRQGRCTAIDYMAEEFTLDMNMGTEVDGGNVVAFSFGRGNEPSAHATKPDAVPQDRT